MIAPYALCRCGDVYANHESDCSQCQCGAFVRPVLLVRILHWLAR